METTPEELSGIVTVDIQSDFITNWWRSFFRNLDIKVLNCYPPSANQIDEALESPFSGNNWTAVKINQVYYVHSGFSLTWGPELGDYLKRMQKAGSSYNLCLNDQCYALKDSIVLSKEEVGGEVSLGDLFDIQQGDIFFLTCWYGHLTGPTTPKLIVQMEPIQ